jgi:hypothetical protein
MDSPYNKPSLEYLRLGQDRLLFDRFVLISRATIRGTLLVGVIQVLAGLLVLLVFGIETWLLYGVVILICSAGCRCFWREI